MLSTHLFESAAFLLGLLLGSFLNVCITRIPLGESIVTPRSRCPVCRHQIRWYDNLPLLSWLLLRGKCRDCKTKIPWRYPAVELAAGLWLAWIADQAKLIYEMSQPDIQPLVVAMGGKAVHSAVGYSSGFIQLFGLAILGLLLIDLIVIDWQHHRLPDALTLPGIVTGLFLVCLQAIFLAPGEGQIIFAFKHLRLASPGSFAARGNVFLTGTEALVYGRLFSVIGAALILLLIRWLYKALRKREGLGLGDVKLIAMIAAFLGFYPALLTLFLGTLLATAYALYLLARKQAHTLTRLPLGTFLCIAGLLTALFGPQIITWYTQLFV